MHITRDQIHLVSASPADDNFLRGLFFEIRASEFRAGGLDEEMIRSILASQFEMQRKSYASQYPEAETTLIMLRDEKIGRLIVNRDAKQLTLVDIAILSRFRSKGIGSFLIGQLIETAFAANTGLAATVSRSNPDALKLYLRLGFRVVSEDEMNIALFISA